jgi:antitoxin FitA
MGWVHGCPRFRLVVFIGSLIRRKFWKKTAVVFVKKLKIVEVSMLRQAQHLCPRWCERLRIIRGSFKTCRVNPIILFILAQHYDSIAVNDDTGLNMATLTIRNLDDTIKTGLRLRAANHGCSMEEEARQILKLAIQSPVAESGLGSRIHGRFAVIGGVDLPLPERTGIRQPPNFNEDSGT